jgi:voltage-gated potassium channel
MYEKLKYRVYDILVETDDGELIDRIVAVLLLLLIFINTITVVLETVDELNQAYGHIFHAIEIVSVAIFTVEYLLRLWVAPLDPQYSGRFGRIRYAFSLMAVIDLLAILPGFLPMIFDMDLRFVRMLRLFRLFRLFKLSRYVHSLDTFDDVIRSKREQLTVTLVLIAMMLLFVSSIMYLIENEAQPDKFPNIPAAMWYGVVTLTTIGYGDVFPITPLGKILGGFIGFLGIGLFALPAGMLASGFADEIAKKNRREQEAAGCQCPHCGEDVSEHFERKVKEGEK